MAITRSSFNVPADLTDTGVAGAALAAGRAVVITKTASGATAAYAGAGTFGGISLDAAASGQPIGVAYGGTGLAIVDADSVNVAVGDPLKAGTDGKLVKAATDKDRYVAIAQQVATTDGAVVKVIISSGYIGA